MKRKIDYGCWDDEELVERNMEKVQSDDYDCYGWKIRTVRKFDGSRNRTTDVVDVDVECM